MCPGPSEALLSGLARLSLSISFSTCNPEALTLGQGLRCHQVINLVTYFCLVLFRWSQNTAMPKCLSETHVLPCSLPPPLGTKGAGRRPGRARSHASCGACRGSRASAGIAGQLLLVQGEHRLYEGPSSSRAGGLPACPREETGGSSFYELTRLNAAAVSISHRRTYPVAALSLLPKESYLFKFKPRSLLS